MTQLGKFMKDSDRVAHDDVHRRRLLRVIDSYDTQVISTKGNQFRKWQDAREIAAAIKDYALAHLPELLERFESEITKRGAKVFWAENAHEAREYIRSVVRANKSKIVVKSKSMITEELDLNELLEAEGAEVAESDLGEFIVQLAGEKPYHIVTPAMHKSKAEIAKVFHEKLGVPISEDAEVLTMIARAHLRQRYIEAGIGISGANFLVSDIGAIAITENEGNARLVTACPPIHIAIAGIEKIIPRMRDLELFWPLLATSGTGQQVTCYNSLIRGPRGPNEPDGPREMHVVLVDNGRTNIYKDPAVRESLRCIRCGACLNACPVYKTIGGHSYATPYQGPIGAVITPHLKGFKDWGHLSFSSSLCGACTDVCPVEIPLHHMLLANRAKAYRDKTISLFWRTALKGWAFFAASRGRMEFARNALRKSLPFLKTVAPRPPISSVPDIAPKSFSTQWKERRGSK